MNQQELTKLLGELRALPKENEWVEFKVNYDEPNLIGEYISALSNSACLHSQDKAYLVFGIEDETHVVKGTRFKPKSKKVHGEELENWLCRQLNPRIDFAIYEFLYKNEHVALFEIDAAVSTTVKFKDVVYVRIGSYKKRLSEHSDKERKIWTKQQSSDWSSQIIEGATLEDLDTDAVLKARDQFKAKRSIYADEVDSWDNVTFLNKAGVTKNGKITNTAIILLGKPETTHYISPAVAQVTWVLKDENKNTIGSSIFDPPFMLCEEKISGMIRNLSFQYLPDTKLFPIKFNQYDSWVIREAFHNCIAHQDYEMNGRIIIVETPEELIFENLGNFLPGSIENVIRRNAPPEVYRNWFLAQAMEKLNMIEILGGGIYRMYTIQKRRYFPLPDYDLNNPEKVIVKIPGRVIDDNYTRMLIERADLDLYTVILLDKVQKEKKLNKEERKILRSKKLIEGKFPNIYVSASIAEITDKKAQYIRQRGFERQHYKDLIVQFLNKYGSATRKDIDDLLMDKLPDILNEEQKRIKTNNLIREMSKTVIMKNMGSRKNPKWVLSF